MSRVQRIAIASVLLLIAVLAMVVVVSQILVGPHAMAVSTGRRTTLGTCVRQKV